MKLRIPDDLFVIGTMNLIDQSIEQIDFALRRRFLWLLCPFDAEALLGAAEAKWRDLKSGLDWDRIEPDFRKLAAAASALNRQIHDSPLLGAQYEIGHTYLRQVDVPGVDSKFIEAHRGVLTELLDLALPPEVVETHATGVAQFTRRFGFLDKPVRIRFRLLDPALPSLPGCEGLPDITLDAASFAALALPVQRVFITENETNFLAFPPAANAIAVFGAGYGWEALARAEWLHRCQLHYWGDIDTHGFAILDQLRGDFPGAVSFLMDRETLLAHRLHWGEEPDPVRHDLSRLTTEEAAVYDDLRFDRHQPRLRLEQERVGFGRVKERLRGLSEP